MVGNSGNGNVAVLMGTGSARPVPSRTGVLVTGRGLLVATGWAWLLSRNTRDYNAAGSNLVTIVSCNARVCVGRGRVQTSLSSGTNAPSTTTYGAKLTLCSIR